MNMEKEAHASRGFFDGLQSQSSSPHNNNPTWLSSLAKPGGTMRNHFVAGCGEFLGTFLFLFFAFSGTQVANSETQGGDSTTMAQGSNPAQLLYISLCFGFSLAVNAWVFFRISGGLFNPAVTLGMCLISAVPWARGLVVFIAQILGGISAAAVVSALYPGPLNVRTTLGAGTSKAQGVFIEMFLTAELVFAIFMLAAEKHKGTFIAPVGIGLALFIAELGGVYYTGGSLNPARSFGPNVVTHTFEDYHWIYWLGPILGSLLASLAYKVFKSLSYETANPGQDFDENETKLFDPEKGSGVDRPIVALAASASNANSNTAAGSSSRRNSRPISGDTLGGFRRKESSVGGGLRGGSVAGMGVDDSTAAAAPPGSREGRQNLSSNLTHPTATTTTNTSKIPALMPGATDRPRRGSSPLSPLGMHTPSSSVGGATNRSIHEDYGLPGMTAGAGDGEGEGKGFAAALEVEEGRRVGAERGRV